MRFFKTLISLHTVKLIVISVIAIIYLATTTLNSSNKTEFEQERDSIVKKDSVAHEETKGLRLAEGEFVTTASQVDYDAATELDKK